jgi:hypothetical protein
LSHSKERDCYEKAFTVAVIGAGGRGSVCSELINLKEEFTIVAACDIIAKKLENLKNFADIRDEALFTDDEEFFKERRADVQVIGTCNADHVRHCVRAMKLGYNVLLEKPISDSREEIQALEIKSLNVQGWGHGGGDYGVVESLFAILNGDTTDYTSLEESLESHLMGVAAEESRLDGGKVALVHQ